MLPRICHQAVGENSSTSFLGLLVSEGLVTDDELVDLVLKLSTLGYVACAGAEILYILYRRLFEFGAEQNEALEAYLGKLSSIFGIIYSPEFLAIYGSTRPDLMKLIRFNGLDHVILYQLVRQPLGLPPYLQVIADALDSLPADPDTI